jgi:hypothetical protein
MEGKTVSELTEEVEDAIGLDTYGYPRIDIMRGAVRITLGWFFVDDEFEDEPASYVEQWIDAKGKQRFVIDVYMSFSFDFITKLRDYGWWVDHGFGKYWVYADHHIRKRDQIAYWLRNFPFRTKRKLHSFGIKYIPIYRKIFIWYSDRKMRRLFR